jgi:hypothetical protein
MVHKVVLPTPPFWLANVMIVTSLIFVIVNLKFEYLFSSLSICIILMSDLKAPFYVGQFLRGVGPQNKYSLTMYQSSHTLKTGGQPLNFGAKVRIIFVTAKQFI